MPQSKTTRNINKKIKQYKQNENILKSYLNTKERFINYRLHEISFQKLEMNAHIKYRINFMMDEIRTIDFIIHIATTIVKTNMSNIMAKDFLFKQNQLINTLKETNELNFPKNPFIFYKQITEEDCIKKKGCNNCIEVYNQNKDYCDKCSSELLTYYSRSIFDGIKDVMESFDQQFFNYYFYNHRYKREKIFSNSIEDVYDGYIYRKIINLFKENNIVL